MQNAAVSEYELSLPMSVTSVPCNVVMTCGTLVPDRFARIWRARYAAAACGIA